ncbi:MAG TPA: Nif3-like dinuclear metal center hexameric protein [Lutibacter sp.]|nr:Nif3-like dinuclear metal center hexameric protein [Lutibacter sp.]
MKIKEVLNHIEKLAPLSYAEDFDNVGLLVGNASNEITNVLVTLDTLENTIDEAIAKNCNLIISFHPIIFSGLKSITGKNYVERVVLKAIKNDIAIYATHTALDNVKLGVSGKMAEVLGLKNTKVLLPKKNSIKKLITYVPDTQAESLRNALFSEGAGHIGNYEKCSYNSKGIGTYLPSENANPNVGSIGKLQQEPETAITVYFEKHQEQSLLKALFKNHPYEEVAYEISTLENSNQHIGLGIYGELPNETSEKDFLDTLKDTFNLTTIRHSKLLNKPVKTVAVLGGSGSFALKQAIQVKADVYVSADFKYHDFFGAEKMIVIADIGHYESEQFTKNLLVDYLTKKFTNFAIILSETKTNPIYNY